MNNWFSIKVKYTKQLDNGALKRVTEPYLMAAVTFSDAEERVYKELEQIIRGEFNVVSIQRTEIHDLFLYADTGVFYKAKVSYENIDADSERSKTVSQNFLVEAGSVKQATERINTSLKDMLVEFKIKSVIESPIIDIWPYITEVEFEDDESESN